MPEWWHCTCKKWVARSRSHARSCSKSCLTLSQSTRVCGHTIELWVTSTRTIPTPKSIRLVGDVFSSRFCFHSLSVWRSCGVGWQALGSVYLLHRDLADVDRYDYDDRAWSPLSGAPGSAVQCNGTSPHVRKTKFVLGQFGVMRSSRKGGLRTGWRINGRPLQMVNVHLFADVSNIDAAAQTPSKDALIRRAALEFLIDGVSDPAHESDDSGGPAVEESTDGRPGKRSRKGPARAQLPEAAFFFGDFNFRLANSELAQHISSGSRGKFCRNRPDHPPTKVVYNKRGSGAPALVLEKKKFLVTDPEFYAAESLADLRQFDLEGNEFDTLLEMERRFLPSYPFVDSDGPAADSGQVYAKTRAPAWCDRVLMNPQARSLVKDDSFSYFCIGENVPMGDHKPVALALQLI
eukprot:m.130715 g.130715  ORF g.130715 m.130715 type:complete len:406 (+) comp13726_c0_seq5:111-1328(+)